MTGLRSNPGAGTPGPWRVAPWTTNEAQIVAGPRNKPSHVTGYALLADARLISTAPDGYRLANDIADLEAMAEHAPEPLSERLLAAVDQAKALVRKARGQS